MIVFIPATLAWVIIQPPQDSDSGVYVVLKAVIVTLDTAMLAFTVHGGFRAQKLFGSSGDAFQAYKTEQVRVWFSFFAICIHLHLLED
jgi:hypothetical protein